jgi:hypothetical protein
MWESTSSPPAHVAFFGDAIVVSAGGVLPVAAVESTQVAGPATARLSLEQVAEARWRHRNGESIRALARAFGVAHSTLAAHLPLARACRHDPVSIIR